MIRQIFALIVLCSIMGPLYAAMCGKSEYFEYKFKPLKVGPVKEDDKEHAHGRCGTGEKHCEVMIQISGRKECKKGRNNEGEVLMGPDSKNYILGNEFTPNMIDWRVHSDWELSKAFENPFNVQVCDHDSAFRGGNDQIIDVVQQHLQEGCHAFRHQDEDADHPWFIEYEVCCRPIAKPGFFRGQKGGK